MTAETIPYTVELESGWGNLEESVAIAREQLATEIIKEIQNNSDANLNIDLSELLFFSIADFAPLLIEDIDTFVRNFVTPEGMRLPEDHPHIWKNINLIPVEDPTIGSIMRQYKPEEVPRFSLFGMQPR